MLRKTLFAAALLAIALSAPSPTLASAVVSDLGNAGTTYGIAEPDALVEIETAARGIDWESKINPEQQREKIKNFQPENLRRLPPAPATRSRMIDMTYALDMDIPDGRGGILYPAGYTFNPLDYQMFTGVLVVIDATDERQVEWFEQSRFRDDLRVMLLISDGSYYEMMERFDRPVFYLMDEVADRLQLRAAPSLVRQNGRMMEVREVAVTDQMLLPRQVIEDEQEQEAATPVELDPELHTGTGIDEVLLLPENLEEAGRFAPEISDVE